MTYDIVKIVPTYMGTLDYWQGLGGLGNVWLVSGFPFLEHFPLRIKVLDHHVPQNVGGRDALSGGLIVS